MSRGITRRIAAWQERIASWADSRLLPVLLVILLATDLLVGLNWFLSPATKLSSPAYDVGERLLSMATWGVLFLIATAASATAFLTGGRGFVPGYIIGALLSGLWGFWSWMFLAAPMGRSGASWTLAILAVGMCLLHCVAGIASLARPAPVSLGRDVLRRV